MDNGGMSALPRVGIGTDVHAFATEGSGRELWVAGLHWPGERHCYRAPSAVNDWN